MADNTEQKPIGFPTFGGLRLDLGLDEVGGNESIYNHDIDWDGSLGKLRTRDGFQKLNATAGTGNYKGLFPHSALRLLAVRRVSGTEAKVVALDKEGAVKAESAALSPTEAPSTFAHIGVPATAYTFMRTNVTTQKVIRFDGTTFTEPKATIENTEETGGKETPKTEKEMPKGRHMVGWPDASNVLVTANTATTGGPNGAASSNSHVWFSRPGSPEAYEETAFIRLGVGDGEEITGLCVYGAQLYVFKETRFWVVSPPSTNERGQPVFSFREVSLGEGARTKQVLSENLKETSDRICWPSQDGVFFCTTDGIYQTTGGSPGKISSQLKPLEETVPFEGPMAEYLNGSTESFRWPATGIMVLGRRVLVKRYEFMFIYDIPTEAWACWKMPSVSFAIWTGLTGGGAEGVERSPTSAESTTGAGAQVWTEPGSVNAEAGKVIGGGTAETELPGSGWAYAKLSGSSETKYLKATNFGFAIPAGSTIQGITFSFRCRSFVSSTNQVLDSHVQIAKAGTIQTIQDKASSEYWPSPTPARRSYGSAEDLWGVTWAPSDINSTGFGVAIAAKHLTEGLTYALADGFKISVAYLTAESASGIRPRMFCTQTKYAFWTGPTAEEQATFPGWAWQSGLYDLGSEDEKELVYSKLWGKGTINLGVSKDFEAMKERKTFAMGEATTQKRANIAQTGTLFSHRFSGTGKASIQRFVRYLRTTRTSTTESKP